jgi:hypothetical protein
MGPVPKDWGQLRLLTFRISLVASSTITKSPSSGTESRTALTVPIHLISPPMVRNSQCFSSHLDHRGSRWRQQRAAYLDDRGVSQRMSGDSQRHSSPKAAHLAQVIASHHRGQGVGSVSHHILITEDQDRAAGREERNRRG